MSNISYVTVLCFTGQFDQPVFVTLSSRERILTSDEIESRTVERSDLHKSFPYELYSAGFTADTQGEVWETTYGYVDNSKTMIKQISCRVVG